jgi:hypothetical protein
LQNTVPETIGGFALLTWLVLEANQTWHHDQFNLDVGHDLLAVYVTEHAKILPQVRLNSLVKTRNLPGEISTWFPEQKKLLLFDKRAPEGWALIERSWLTSHEEYLIDSKFAEEYQAPPDECGQEPKGEDATSPQSAEVESTAPASTGYGAIQDPQGQSEATPDTSELDRKNDAASGLETGKKPKSAKRSQKSAKPDTATAAGEVVTALLLRRRFGPHYESVLEERLQEVEGDGPRKFKLLQPLPTKEQYEGLVRKAFTSSVQSLVEEAFSVFESLRDEYQDWRDNLPEALQDGSKASELDDAIQQLEELGEPDLPSWADQIQVFHLPSSDVSSRPKQLAEATDAIRDCVTEIERLIDSGDYERLEAEDEEINADSLRELADALQGKVDDAESVSLPGMF